MNNNAKNKYVSLLLCIFLGGFGAHKFYEGKIGMGILYIFTGGLFGIGWIVDIITIVLKPNPYYVNGSSSVNTNRNYANTTEEFPSYSEPNYVANTTINVVEKEEEVVQPRTVICEGCGAPNTLVTETGVCEYCGTPIN